MLSKLSCLELSISTLSERRFVSCFLESRSSCFDYDVFIEQYLSVCTACQGVLVVRYSLQSAEMRGGDKQMLYVLSYVACILKELLCQGAYSCGLLAAIWGHLWVV